MAITILDGGMSRELLRVGAPFEQPEWSALALMETPDLVAEVHEDFVQAGATVLTTNAYAVVPYHLGVSTFADRGRSLVARSARLARMVADRHPGVRVAGCLPPVLGSYRPDLFDAAAAAPLLRVLVEAQEPLVDLWLLETQSSVAEVETAARVIDRLGGDHPWWCAYTLEDTLAAGSARLRSRESIESAVSAAVMAGASAVGFNCSRPEVMETALLAARDHTDLPLLVYANTLADDDGEANEQLADTRDDVDPVRYREFADRWIEAGATIIGGCCGVGCEHVAALADAAR